TLSLHDALPISASGVDTGVPHPLETQVTKLSKVLSEKGSTGRAVTTRSWPPDLVAHTRIPSCQSVSVLCASGSSTSAPHSPALQTSGSTTRSPPRSQLCPGRQASTRATVPGGWPSCVPGTWTARTSLSVAPAHVANPPSS